MIVKFIKISVVIYQNISRTRYASCRFTPTCSQYAIECIEKYGAMKGLYKSTKRILSCQPFSKRPIFDPA